MKTSLYFECRSGISGDMTVAALLDLGADEKILKKALRSLPLDGFEIKISRVQKNGIEACDFDVVLEDDSNGYDHDMNYLHGTDHRTDHSKAEHAQTEHPQNHRHAHPHIHRGLKEVEQIIRAGDMSQNARTIALNTFRILAEAEAKAHRVPVNKVHFHEVGAADSIIDIIAAAVCLDSLGIEDVIVPVLYDGTGTIRCRHGILPVPVPAVKHIAADQNLDLKIIPVNGELVTPTGAALAAAFRTSTVLPDSYTVESVGLGAGKRDYKTAGVLRTMIISSLSPEEAVS